MSRALDDDVNCFLGRLFGKDVRDVICWVKFLLLFLGDAVEQDGDFAVVPGDRDGNAPEGELVRCNVVEGRCLIRLDEVFEITNSVRERGLDGKCSGRR